MWCLAARPSHSRAARRVIPPRFATEARLMLVSPRAVPRRRRGRPGGGIAMRAYRVILRVVFWVILSVVLVAASFWVYAIVTGGKNF